LGDVNTGAAVTAVEVEVTWNPGAVLESNGSVASLNGSGRLSLDTTGQYLIILDVAYDKGANNLRTIIRTRLSDDAGSTFLTPTDIYTYHRAASVANAVGSGSLTYVYNVTTASTAISIFAVQLTGGGTANPRSQGYRCYATKLT
jgi:hypothetical protein